VPIVPALGIFPPPNKDPMPWDKYDAERVFWTTSIVPMGGHVVVERLDCNSDIRVRVVVNGRVQPIPGCNAPADQAALGICQLEQFEQIVKGRWEKTFCEACAPDQPECVNSISFYEA
jgi:acid phosphatase